MIESPLFGIKENPLCPECMDSGVVVSGYAQESKGNTIELRDVCECVIKHTRDASLDVSPKITRKSWHERIDRD